MNSPQEKFPALDVQMNWKQHERKDLIKELKNMGCMLIRHGGKHDWYQNPKTKISQPVPRHREINEYLAKHIIKMLKS